MCKAYAVMGVLLKLYAPKKDSESRELFGRLDPSISSRTRLGRVGRESEGTDRVVSYPIPDRESVVPFPIVDRDAKTKIS
ncbi:hypothetical protein SUGI_1455580 [Cryptomeria japonica]|uniref:Uncharacterized protein n=1 Tax=Cryptomeria japonica TaxID=3369 RepID=A0AAD3RQU7_CRYJA|nr:hypothetical protein SUGI_1455580 [Cryptomeria japonica]